MWNVWEHIYIGFLIILILAHIVNLSHHGLKYFFTKGDFIYIGAVVSGIIFAITNFSSDYFVNNFIEESQRHGMDITSSKRLSVNVYYQLFTKVVCCLLAIFCILFVFKSFIFNRVIHRCHLTLILMQSKIVWLLILIYLLIYFESYSLWYEITNDSRLIIELPASLINTFTCKQLILRAADPSNQIGLLLYGLFCGTGFCILCAKIVHHYGITKYYTRNNFYTDDLHTYVFKKIKLFFRRLKEKCPQKPKRLKGGCNTETTNMLFTTEQIYLKKKVDDNVNLKEPPRKSIGEKRRGSRVVTEEINKNLNIIINKLYQPDIYH